MYVRTRTIGMYGIVSIALLMMTGCNATSGVAAENGNTTGNGTAGGGGTTGGGSDTGGGNTGGGDTGGGASGGNNTGGTDKPAIVKTQIVVGTGGQILPGDDLIVYGVGADEDETQVFGRFNQPAGVHFIIPSQSDRHTTAGTMIPGSDRLFGHRNFVVTGKKVALIRSTNAVSIYDSTTGSLFDIPITDISLVNAPSDQAGPLHMTTDGPYIATVNRIRPGNGTPVTDAHQIKVIDTSGPEPVIISLPEPDEFAIEDGSQLTDDFQQAVVHAESRQVAALSNNDIFLYDLDNPTAQPRKFDFDINAGTGLVSNAIALGFDGDHVLYYDDLSLDSVVSLLNVSTGEIIRFIDNSSPVGLPVALKRGSFLYFLSREQADEGDEFNSRRAAIGSVNDAPAATLASQLDRYPLRPTVVDTSTIAGPVAPDQCRDRKLVGYGATTCVTPDGGRWFLAGWRTIDSNFDYVQMSTGGAFTDFTDPEGTTVTGSLMGTDVSCAHELVAFRALREIGEGTGCSAIEDNVIAFIRIDELD